MVAATLPYKMNPHLDLDATINNNYYPQQLQVSQTSLGYPCNMAPDLTPQQANIQMPSKFTFGVPTQAAMSFSRQRPMNIINTPICHAPGIGTSWQHTIPTQIGFGVPTNPGVMTFTGNLEPYVVDSSGAGQMSCGTYGNIGISAAPYVSYNHPRPSCSIASRRPKRRAEDITSEISSKVYLSESKMMEQMQALSLDQQKMKQELAHPAFRDQQQSGLERLREIEARLKDEDMNEVPMDKLSRGARLEIIDGLEKEVFKPSSILPRKILEEMCSKPCMEVVLWRPPPHVSTSCYTNDPASELSSTTSDLAPDSTPVTTSQSRDTQSKQDGLSSSMSWSNFPCEESFQKLSNFPGEMEIADDLMVL